MAIQAAPTATPKSCLILSAPLILKLFYRKETRNEQHFSTYANALLVGALYVDLSIGEINIDAGIYKILSRRMTPQLAKFIADKFWIVNSGCPDSCER